MSVTTLVEFALADVAIYKDCQFHSCRDILLQNIQHVSYAGDLRGFVNEAIVLAGIRQANLKILRLLDHVAALKSVRNSFSPTARLPSEILVQIFALCTNRHTEPRRKHWLAFSQVCSRWRQLALSHPLLWTHLDSDADEQLAGLMAARSNAVPVSISTHDIQRLVRVAPLAARVRSLALTLTRRPTTASVVRTDKYFSSKFPEMESLWLAASAASRPPQYDLQAFEAPRLQAVKLQNWFVRDWGVPFLARLTHLELTFSLFVHPEHLRSTPSLAALLAMLDRNTDLRSLVLHNAYHFDYGRASEVRTEPVVLPHLTKLRLSDSISRVSALLELLVLPEVEDVCVTFTNDSSGVQLQALLKVLDVILQNEAWTTLYCGRNLRIRNTTVVVSNNPGLPRGAATRAPSRLELVYSAPDAQQSAAFLNAFVAVLPRTAVTTLDAQMLQHTADIDLNQSFWGVMSLFPALATVTVSTVHVDTGLLAMRGLLDALSPPVSVPGARQDPINAIHIRFPALRDLTFSRLNLKDNTATGEIALAILEAFAEQRARQGKHVRVVFRDCLFTNLERDKLEAGLGYLHIVNSDRA